MAAWQSNRALGRFRPRGCGETVPAHRWISCFARPSHRTRVRPQAAQNDRSRRLKVDNVPGEPSRISTEKRTSSMAHHRVLQLPDVDPRFERGKSGLILGNGAQCGIQFRASLFQGYAKFQPREAREVVREVRLQLVGIKAKREIDVNSVPCIDALVQRVSPEGLESGRGNAHDLVGLPTDLDALAY